MRPSRRPGAWAWVSRPKTAIPQFSRFAILANPEMNVFAIWQIDPNAA